jgi:hypothetical protein
MFLSNEADIIREVRAFVATAYGTSARRAEGPTASLAVMLGLASHPAAQSPAGPAFEVASVKPSNPDMPGPRGMPVAGRFNASNLTLRGSNSPGTPPAATRARMRRCLTFLIS